jgi:hypothetical protein
MTTQMLNARGETPQFDRLNYFYGQLLGAQQLRTEQSYFREKMRLHNRCLHGWGAVCGLGVVQDATSVDPCGGAAPAKGQPGVRLRIDPGLGLDPGGNELVVRHPIFVDVWSALSAADQRRVTAANPPIPIWVSLCYVEIPLDPARPVMPDACSASGGAVPGKLRDAVCVTVTADEPKDDQLCASCCTPPSATCLLLARIDAFSPGVALDDAGVHSEVRRNLGTYPYTTVDGIGWAHGATYDAATANQLMQGDADHPGLAVHFSRPIRTATIVRGVVDAWLVQEAGARAVSGGFVCLPGAVTPMQPEAPAGFTQGLYYKCPPSAKLSMQDGDRVLIEVRAPFLLDECCRPVDGAHTGGRVPALSKDPAPISLPQIAGCEQPPQRFGGWTSGTGAPGASFQSWFFIGVKP